MTWSGDLTPAAKSICCCLFFGGTELDFTNDSSSTFSRFETLSFSGRAGGSALSGSFTFVSFTGGWSAAAGDATFIVLSRPPAGTSAGPLYACSSLTSTSSSLDLLLVPNKDLNKRCIEFKKLTTTQNKKQCAESSL